MKQTEKELLVTAILLWIVSLIINYMEIDKIYSVYAVILLYLLKIGWDFFNKKTYSDTTMFFGAILILIFISRATLLPEEALYSIPTVMAIIFMKIGWDVATSKTRKEGRYINTLKFGVLALFVFLFIKLLYPFG
ncbi:hypothetical protein [Virgibacillus halodenitrificans]|uniref:hypothetical protein n=1 Tax=Virgibacillus halodenitrificans TaxID=1482 RepID=UPI000EF555C4|nr:hypothetical protein [Virgibacillus halodenitrificans]